MIEFKEISKEYQGKSVLRDINLSIQTGELVSLVGPSGSGKTTLLKMVNRLLEPSEGQILIDGQDIKNQSVHQLRLQMGYVLQQIALFPHLTVFENISLILELKKIPKAKWQNIAKKWLLKVGLDAEEFLDRYPSELSGGQQQRVGIVRALVGNPKIILMDEPFSALDPINRLQLQELVKRLQIENHLTILFVTHDMQEAKRIADKIALIQEGKLLQYDTFSSMIENPKNDWVLQFLQGGMASD